MPAARLLALALTAWGAPAPPPGAPGPVCPDRWLIERRGDCWVLNPDRRWAYVHGRGWMVGRECFEDPRFSREELLAALDGAYRKIDPRARAGAGGCLGTFNPDWGRALTDFLWAERTVLSCWVNDPRADSCADTAPGSWAATDPSGRARSLPYHLITMGNVRRCLAAGGSGLSGVLFHETLHAARADSLPRSEHNRAWDLPQERFVQDRVYGAEAVCFFGTSRRSRRFVNLLQCLRVVEMDADRPREGLCAAFDASFTNTAPAPGFIKH